jgi:hypothetical protein
MAPQNTASTWALGGCLENGLMELACLAFVLAFFALSFGMVWLFGRL